MWKHVHQSLLWNYYTSNIGKISVFGLSSENYDLTNEKHGTIKHTYSLKAKL
jgi:hypothetical protein